MRYHYRIIASLCYCIAPSPCRNRISQILRFPDAISLSQSPRYQYRKPRLSHPCFYRNSPFFHKSVALPQIFPFVAILHFTVILHFFVNLCFMAKSSLIANPFRYRIIAIMEASISRHPRCDIAHRYIIS